MEGQGNRWRNNNGNKRGGNNGNNRSGNNENKRGGNNENQRNDRYGNRRDDRNRSGSGNDHNVNQRQRNYRENQNREPNNDDRNGNVPHYQRSGSSQSQYRQRNVQNHNSQHYQDNRKFNTRQNQVFTYQGGNVMVNHLSGQFNTLHLNNFVGQLNIPQAGGYNEQHFYHQRIQHHQQLMYRTPHKRLDLHSLRKWENLTGNQEPDMHSGFIFTIMTYNVLAQGLIDQHLNLYREHNSTNLNWEVRWPKLLQEIGTLKPDILCLQEVQESHVQDHFNTLSALGYTGIYKKRTGGRIDGCAIYYKSNNLTLIEHTAVEYFQPSVKLLNRDNVALIAKFSPKFHLKEFIVATTHLLYNPKREDVRMAQVQLLLTEIERLSYKNDGRQASYLPVILTGDFNALPNSVLYQFLTRGTMIYNNLNSNLVDRRFPQPMLVTTNLGISDDCQHVELLDKRQNNANLSRSDESDLIKLTSGKRNSTMKMLNNSTFIPGKGVLTHKFNFKTAYDNQIGTTAQDGIWITVDYIFYSAPVNSSNKLKLLSRYKLPSRKDLENVKIPNESVGSDHLSLVGKFKLD